MSRGLLLRFTRTSPTHHRFQYIRPDGTGETAELETRSVLFHDLLHLAVETEANLAKSFYGLLLGGHTFAELLGKDPARGANVDNKEIILTERIVGPLTSVVKTPHGRMERGVAQTRPLPPRERDGVRVSSSSAGPDPRAFLSVMQTMLEAYGDPMPPWLTEQFIARVKERVRKLYGHWNATPFGQTLELRFPLKD